MDWPAQLVRDFERRRVALFVGSGVSRNSVGADGVTRPKGWEQFLRDAAVGRGMLPRIQAYLQARDYLTALDIIRHGMHRDDYVELVRAEYLTPAFAPAAIHEAIYRLDCKLVLTPNFDKIYDIYAGEKSRGTIDVKEYHYQQLAEYIRGDRAVVIKTHGSVDTATKMIFGRKDYASARVNYAHFYDILRAIVLTHTLLFIGCGTDDPDIRQLLEDINFGAIGSRAHYFVAAQGALSRDLQTVLSDTMNLRVLEYDYPVAGDHRALTTGLEELAASLA